MSDLINRQDAINAIKDLPDAENGYSDTYDKACIIGVLEELPFAERKTGKWIYHPDWSFFPYECSECGSTFEYGLDFCGNCGSKMEVQDDC